MPMAAPEVMRWEDIALPAPAAGEARIRHTAIGINYSDINVRRGGFYLARPLRFPVILGNEAAGVVESVGPGVADLRAGDRVAYAGMHGEFFEETGAYAQARNVPAERLIKLPSAISDRQAAAMMVKGFTASLIVNRIFRPKSGDAILIHTAAGGVGRHPLPVVEASRRHRDRHRRLAAKGANCESAWLRSRHSLSRGRFRRGGEVDRTARRAAVFDGVGKDTFTASLDCVRPFGMLVNYGNASGHPPPLDLLLLAKRGSLSVCRPALSSLTADVAGHARGRHRVVRPGRARSSRGRDRPHLCARRRRGRASRHRRQVFRAGSMLLLP